MTAPALASALGRLCELLPERFEEDWNDSDPADVWLVRIFVHVAGAQEVVYWGGDNPILMNMPALEYALREECEARGWRWITQRRGSFEGERACKAVIYDPATKCGPRGFVEREADSPALALALALIASLEGGA